MSAEALPSPATGGNTTKILASALVPSVVLVLAGLLAWRMRRKEPMHARLSRKALLKLGSSSEHDLKFEFDKRGAPVLLGKGGFGEVRRVDTIAGSEDCQNCFFT